MDIYNEYIYNKEIAIGQYGNMTNALSAIEYFNGKQFDGIPTDVEEINELINFFKEYEKPKIKSLVIDDKPNFVTKIKNGKLNVKFKVKTQTRPSVRCNECARKKKKCERENQGSVCYGCKIIIDIINLSIISCEEKKEKINEISTNCLNPDNVKKYPYKN